MTSPQGDSTGIFTVTHGQPISEIADQAPWGWGNKLSAELNVRGSAGEAGHPVAPDFRRPQRKPLAPPGPVRCARGSRRSGSRCSAPGRTPGTCGLLSAGAPVLGRLAGFPGCRLWSVSSKTHGEGEL